MAINITPTTIQVGNFKFRETDTGIEFTGQANTAGFVGGSQAQGSVSGFINGGEVSGPTMTTDVESFPFATDTNATSGVATLSQGRASMASSSSETDSYSAGGNTPSNSNVIDKYPFASGGTATDVGDLTKTMQGNRGITGKIHGYSVGGANPPETPDYITDIQRFPFAVDTNAILMGTLTVGRYSTAGAASDTHGYTAGGYGPGAVNTIDKFPFATENNATDVGDLTQARFLASGTNSGENGYASGGFAPSAPGRVNIIDKYPFSTDTNASDVGDLSTTNRDKMAGNSSKTHGYGSSGESTPSPAPTVPEATIDKFPFAVDANATDVGDVATNRVRSHGTQH